MKNTKKKHDTLNATGGKKGFRIFAVAAVAATAALHGYVEAAACSSVCCVHDEGSHL